jgi:hypothetical protein
MFKYIERFFQYLSKTDPRIIAHPLCSASRMTQTSLGVMVLFTGILAFFSGSYAVFTAFNSLSLSIVVGIIYALMIITFDREIVSATDKRAVVIRLPLALFIGVIVAVPIELQLLEDRINKELDKQSLIENKQALDRRNTAIDRLRNRREQLESEAEQYRKDIRQWEDAMDAEITGKVKAGRTGIEGEGPAYRSAKERRDATQRLLAEVENQLKKIEENERDVFKLANEDFKQQSVKQTYGFLSKMEALGDLKNHSSTILWTSWAIKLLFITLELFPALVKLFLPYSTYNALVEASRRQEIQRVHAICNKSLQEIEQNPTINQPRLLDQLNIP